MRKVIALLCAFLLMGSTTVDAATTGSHTATQCLHNKVCYGNGYVTGGTYEYDCTNHGSVSQTVYYCSVCGEVVHTTDDSTFCGNFKRYLEDMGAADTEERAYDVPSHSLGAQPCSSSNRCTTSSHYSYRTRNHYYCTTHNYIGTSSTCPGLTLNPSPSSMSLYIGQSRTITPNPSPSSASVSYTSSNVGVASVSSSGKVTAKKKGSATITITGVM